MPTFFGNINLRVDFPIWTARAGGVQRGVVLLKELWTFIVFWPDTCLVELTMSYDQFQSLMLSFKVL